MATTLVAEDGAEVIGYLYFQVFSGEGVIRHVVVAPSHHGRRIGQQLMEAAAEVMRTQGCTRWALNVKPDNTPARRLYARMGMAEAYRSQSLRFAWSVTERLPAPLSPLAAFDIPAARDPEVEAAMRLPRGLLAGARALPDRVLRAVAEADRVVAAAVFVPAFPGAYPFRAASPAAARALLEALRPAALAEPPYMQAVIEGQPALARALRDAGAVVRLDIVHLEGPLPPDGGIDAMRLKAALRWLLTGFMVAAGANHFVSPATYVGMMPDALPAHLALVYASGVAEILGGLGLIPRATRRLAAWGLIALLLAIFPANINMALHELPLGTTLVPSWALWARLPLQAVLIAWAWWYTRPEAAPRRGSEHAAG